MPLTAAQKLTLRTHIQANTTQLEFGGGLAAINTVFAGASLNSGDALLIAGWYSQLAAPAYVAWNTTVPIKSIRSLVNLQNFTPADAVPASGATAQVTNDQLVYQNRALVCQLKQANAIFLIQGEGSVDCTPLQLRQSFNDCMTAIPSGANGNNQNAGWGTSGAPGAVRLAMQRQITNLEKVFSVASTAGPNAGNVGTDARGGTTNPDTLVVLGGITGDEISDIHGLPA